MNLNKIFFSKNLFRDFSSSEVDHPLNHTVFIKKLIKMETFAN